MKRHQVQPRLEGLGLWRCTICGRKVIQTERFMLMRDETGASLGTTEMKTLWRHRPIRKAAA